MKKLFLALLTVVLGASFIYPPAIIKAKDEVLFAVNSRAKLWDFSVESKSEPAGTYISAKVNSPIVAASVSLVSGSNINCADGISTLTLQEDQVVNAVTYEWTAPVGFIPLSQSANQITYQVSQNAVSGNVLVKVINDLGEETTSAPYLVTINPLPTATFSLEETISLGQAILIGPEVNNSYNYSWTNTSSSTVLSLASKLGVSPTQDATYDLTIQDKTTLCEETYRVAVFVKTPTVTEITPGLYCLDVDNPGIIRITGTDFDELTGVLFDNFVVTDYVKASNLITINSLPNGVTSSAFFTLQFGDFSKSFDEYNVTVQRSPLAAGAIIGDTEVCAGATKRYIVPTIDYAASYLFEVDSASGLNLDQPTLDSNYIDITFGPDSPSSITLSVKGTNSCDEGASSSIVINVSPLPSDPGAIQIVNGFQNICADGTEILELEIPAILNAISYKWSAPEGFVIKSGGNTQQIEFTITEAAQSGNIQVRGVNACGEGVLSPAFPVTISSIPTATFNLEESICVGQTVELGPEEGAVDGYSYSWTLLGGSDVLSQQANYTVDPIENTNYVLTISDNVTGCELVQQISVYVDTTALEIGIISGDSLVCIGTNNRVYSVDGPDNLTYTWTLPQGATLVTGQGTKEISVNFTDQAQSDNIKVTGTNACGVESDEEVLFVTVDDVPGAPQDLVAPTTICKLDVITISVDPVPGKSFTWYVPDGFNIIGTNDSNQLQLEATNTAVSGTISVGINYSCGVGPLTSQQITVNELPVAQAGNDISICLDNSATIGSNGNGYVSYSWESFPSDPASISNPSIPNPSVSPLQTTRYVITVVDNNGCEDTDEIIVTVLPKPSATLITNSAICFNESISLGSRTLDTNSYTWTSSNGDIPFGPNFEVTPTSTTTYYLTETNPLTGCSATNEVTITVAATPVITTGPDATICEDQVYNIETSGASYNSQIDPDTVVWSLQEASGQIDAPATFYTPNATDIARGYFILKYTGQGLAPCEGTYSDVVRVDILKNPTVAINSVDAICEGETIVLNAIATSASGITWTFPGRSVSGTNYTYTPTATDISNGSVVISVTAAASSPCGEPATASKTINITRKPTVFAGSRFPSCSVDGIIDIDANNVSVTNAAGIEWSIISGSGTLTNETTQSPSYTPSTADYANGSVTLRLTAFGNAPCDNNNTSDLIIDLFSAPEVSAGSDAQICASDNYTISDAAPVNAANILSYRWTIESGPGSILAGTEDQLNPIFVPSNTLNTPTQTTLKLVASPKAPCTEEAADTVIITTYPVAIVNAGTDASICSSDSSPLTYSLSAASVTNYVGLVWSTSGTGSFSNLAVQNPTYSPSAEDIENGSVVLKLKANQDNCSPVEDTMVLSITKEVAVFAGSSGTICAGDSFDITDATSSNPNATYSWEIITNGVSGILENANTLLPTFVSAPTDSGVVTLRLTVTPQSGSVCDTAKTSQVDIIVNPAPTAEAGPSHDICEGETVNLTAATATNYETILWTSDGDGTFVSNNDLKPIYSPGPNDIASGGAILTMSVAGNDGCTTILDTTTVQITRKPEISIVPATIEVCEDLPSYTFKPAELNGQDIDTYLWSTNSNGSFNSTENIAEATYTFSQDDINAGQVVLNVTVTNANSCDQQSSDTVVIEFIRNPVVSTGENPEVAFCTDLSFYAINNATSAYSSSVVWSSASSGSTDFSAPTALITNYTPNATDIANGSVVLTLTGQSEAGCTETATASFTLIIEPAPIITVPSVNPKVCSSDSYTVSGISIENDYDPDSVELRSRGSGGFDNNNNLNAIYTPSVQDIENGSVIIDVLVSPNSSCNSIVVNSFTLDIVSAPTVSISFERKDVCEGPVDIGGLLTTEGDIASYSWVALDGNGTFNNSSIAEPIYTPDASDYDQEFVTLEVTVNPTSPCATPAKDTIKIYYNKQPKILSLSHDEVCASDPIEFVLNTDFSFENAASHTFITSDGAVSNASAPSVTIVPNAAAIAKGYADITLSLTPLTPCEDTITETLRVNIQEIPSVVAAVPSPVICEGETISTAPTTQENIDLSTIQWSASSGVNSGAFASDSSLVTTYTPSDTDISNGYVELTITANGEGPCATDEISDTIRIDINKAPVLTLLTTLDSRTICDNQAYTVTDSDFTTIENDTSILWIVKSGNGSLANPNTKYPTYTAAPEDLDLPGGKAVLEASIQGEAGCSSAAVDILEIIIAPQATLTIPDPTVEVCVNGSVTLAAEATNYDPDSVLWEIVTGNGTLINAETLNPTFVSEVSTTNVTVRVQVTSTDPCTTVIEETLTITASPINTPTIGVTEDYLCSTPGAAYNITTANAVDPSSVQWSTSGTGEFSNASDINPIYTPSSSDIDSGEVILTLTGLNGPGCDESTYETATITLTFQTPPTASFANDTEAICIGSTYILNDLTASDFDNISWRLVDGNGTLTDSNTETPEYDVASNDSGLVLLEATLTGKNGCDSITINKTLIISPKVSNIDIGLDRTICSGDTVAFTPSILPLSPNAYSEVTWSTSGDGTWSPSNKALNATYTPGTADLANNAPIDITLTITPLASCDSGDPTDYPKATITLDINDPVTVNAGPDISVCENEEVVLTGAQVLLNGVVDSSKAVYWTASSTGGNFSASNRLETTYTLSQTDKANGFVTLTLHAASDAPCPEVIDEVLVSIDKAPVALAGAARNNVCQGSTIIINDAQAENGDIEWFIQAAPGYSLATGTQVLNDTSATPSVVIGEAQQGNLILKLRVTPVTGTSCDGATPVESELVINVQEKPSITEIGSGPESQHCEDTTTYVGTNISVSNANSLVWTSSGNGTFINGSETTQTPQYNPSDEDYANGSVVLSLLAIPIANCVSNVTYDLTLTLIESPEITLVESVLEVCQDIDSPSPIALDGVSYNDVVVSYLWDKTGTGTFSSETSANPTYTPSRNDIEKGQITLVVVATGDNTCSTYTTSENITINFDQIPEILISSVDEICEGEPIPLVTTPRNSVEWGIEASKGSISAFNDTSSINPIYTPTQADIDRGEVALKVRYISENSCGNGPWIIKTIDIQKKPTAVFDLGDSQEICTNEATVGIDVTIENASSFNWTHNGSGTWVFLNPGSNDPDMVYTPVAADYGKTLKFDLTLNPIGSCSNNLKITQEVVFVAAPTANAGADFSSCGTEVKLLNAIASNFSSIEWTTNGGGSFISTNALDPSSYTYLPSPTDINAGSVVLTLKSNPEDGCSDPVTDSVTVSLTEPLSLVVNNPSIDLCENTSYVFKNTDYGVASGNYDTGSVVWEVISGDGDLLNPNSLYPTYDPGAGDTNNSVILELSLKGIGDCFNEISEQFTINYTGAPEVIAGPSQTICASETEVFLNAATASSGLTYQWTTNGDGTFILDNVLNARYNPGSSDRNNGSVVLTLTGTSAAPCNSQDSSEITINIKPEATLELPSNLSFCPGEPVQLNATGNFTSITWTHNGNGSLNSNIDSNPIYTLASDDTAETIVFTAIATLAGSTCAQAVKQVSVTVNEAVSAEAGNPEVLCSADASITLVNGANVNGTSTFSWSLPEGSDGTITNNINSLNPTYTPGPNDKANGTVRLLLTATRAGDCPDSDTDFVDILIPLTPIVEAGSAKASCGINPVPLNDATVNITTNVTYKWEATNGTGNFDDNTKLNAVYTPSNEDLIAGDPIVLRLTATLTSNGCENEVSDTVVLNISGNITVNAGADFATCSSGTFNLVGTITNGSPTSTVWSTIAGGNFGENNLTPSYTPTAADIAAGEVEFTFSAYDSAGCSAGAFDKIRVTFEETPELKIGTGSSTIEICDTQNTIFLNGSVNNPSGITNIRWSNNNTGSGAGVFTSGQNSLNPTYQFSAAEKSQGSVVLTMAADGVAPCANPDPVNVTIQIEAPLTGTPEISGPAAICKDDSQTHNYQAAEIDGADSYNWTVPAGVTIVDGQGTRILSVRFPESANSGDIRVTAENFCGTSSTAILTVTASSKVLGSVLGSEEVCPGATERYIASEVPGATSYTWSYSGTGATINGATNTKEIQVTYSDTATSGAWTVYATLDCGNTNSLVKNITINPLTTLDDSASNIPASICSGPFIQNLIFDNTLKSLDWSRVNTPGIAIASNSGTGLNINDTLVNETGSDIVVTYNLDYIDVNDCSGSTSFNVTVQPEVRLTSSLTYEACSGIPLDYTYENNASGVTYTATRLLPFGISSNYSGSTISGLITETLINSNTTPTDVSYTISQNVNGCSTVVETLVVKVSPRPMLTSGYTDTACEGETFNYNISSSPAFNSVQWTSSTGLTGNTATISEIITANVSYTILLQTSDGCVNSEVLEVRMNPAVEFNLPTSETVCSGDVYSYTITSTADTYSWARPSINGITQGAKTLGSKTINEVLTNNTTDPIPVTYKYTLTKDGCTYEDTLEVIVLPNLEVTSSLNETHCSAATFNYTIESNIPGATYSWSRAVVSGINAAGDTSSGTTAQINEVLTNNTTTNKTVVYEIIVTKDGCISDVQRLEVVVYPLAIFTEGNTLQTPEILCSGGDLRKILQSNIPGSFNWFRNAVPGVSTPYNSQENTNIINETLVNNSDVPVIVTYEITPFNTQECANETQFFYVEVLPTATFTEATLTPQEYCTGAPITHALETNLDSNETVVYTWQRILPSGISSEEYPQSNYTGTGNIIETLRNTTTATINVPYIIKASVDGSSCPEVVETIQIPILPEPILIEKNYVGCSGGTLPHRIQSNIDATYVWQRIPDPLINNGNSFTGTGEFITEILTSTATDVVEVTYIITTTDTVRGCTATDTVNVTLYPNINFDSDANVSVCSEEILDYTISTDTAPNLGLEYTWTRPIVEGISEPTNSGTSNRIFESLTNNTDKPITVVYNITATYDFDYYNNGPQTGQCGKSFDLVVTVYPTTDVSLIQDQTVCNGETLNYTLTSNTPGTTFTWNVTYPQGVTATPGTSGTNVINGTFSHDFDTDLVLNFLVTANSNNCSSETKTLKITVPPKPLLRNAPPEDPICSGTTFNFVPTLNVNSTQFRWTRPLVSGLFNTGNTGVGTISEDLVLSGTSSVVVTYTYVLESIEGCIEDSGSFTVTVVPGVSIDVTDQLAVCNIPSNVNIPLSSNYVDASFKWSRTLPSGVVSDGKLEVYESGPGQSVIQETLTNNNPTTQSVFYTITASRAGVCESVKQIEVPIAPKITLDSSVEETVCSGDPLNYTIATNVPTTYSWTRGANSNITTTAGTTGSGNTISDVLVNTTSVTQEMVYTITATTNAGTICSETFTFTANVAPSVEINSSLSESVCSGPFNYTITTGNNQPNTIYSWSRATISGIQAVGTNGNSATINENLINNTPDPIEVIYELNASVNACDAETKELSVTVYPTTDVSSIIDQVACNGEAFDYELTGSTPNTTFRWDVTYPSGVTSTATTSGTGNINGAFNHDYEYPIRLNFLITASANGCTAVTKTLNVTIPPKPILKNEPVDPVICSGSTFNFVPSLNVNSTQFKWTRVAVSGVLNASNSGIGNISEDLIISGTSSRVVEYTYVLENAEGCVTDTGSFSVSITPGVIISVGDQSEVCNSPSNINIPLTDNFGDANFKWSRILPSGIESIEYLDTYESGLRQTSIQETLINNTSNSIIVYYTLTADRNGACGVTKLIAQPVAPKLALLSSQEEIVCSDNALNYTIATNLPATYTWSRSLPTGVTASTGNLGSGNNINDVLVNSTTTTQEVIYTITATTNSGAICSETLTFTAKVAPSVKIDSPVSEEICSGPYTYTITTENNQPNTTYSWSRATVPGIQAIGTNGNTATINESLINNTLEPIEVIYVLNASLNGCAAETKELSVTVNPSVEVSSAINIETCSDEAFVFAFTSNTPGTTFEWRVISGYSGLENAGSYTQTGTTQIAETFEHNFDYPVDITYAVTPIFEGCKGVPQNFTVSILPKPRLTNAPTTPIEICSGSSAGFTPKVNTASTFRWSRPNALGIGSGANSGEGLINDPLVNTTSGNITVTYTYYLVSPNNCVSDSGTFDVVVNPSIEIDAQAVSVALCDGEEDNLEIQINNPINGANYKWSRTLPSGISSADYSTTSNNNLISGVSFSETLINNSFETKEVTYLIKGSLGDCSSNTEVVVTVLPSPSVISPLSYNACSGVEFEYIIRAPGATGFNWSYNSSANTNITGASSTGEGSPIRETLTNTSTQTQIVTYTITPIVNGCEGKTSYDLQVSVTPEITFTYPTYDEICSGESVPFDKQSFIAPSNSTFTWTRANTAGILEGPSAGNHLNINDETLTNNTNNPIQVTYSLVISSGSCVKEIDYTIIVNPSATMTSAPVVNLCSGESLNYTITSDATAFSWFRNDNNTITGNTASITDGPFVNTSNTENKYTYTIELSGNTDNCGGTATLQVIVQPEAQLTSEAEIEVCSGTEFTYIPVSNLNGATVSWNRQLGAGIEEAPASGAGNIVDTLTAASGVTTTTTVVYDIIFTKNNCSTTRSVTVNVLNQPASLDVVINGDSSNPVEVTTTTEVCSGELVTILPQANSGYVFKRWSRNIVVGIDNQANSGFGPETPISERLINESPDTVEVVYTIVMGNDTCEIEYEHIVSVKPAIGLTLTSLPGTTFQQVCVDALIDPISYEVNGSLANYTLSWYKKNGNAWDPITLSGLTITSSNNILSIQGSSSDSGLFKYILNTTGDCVDALGNPTTASVEGTLEVSEKPLITLAPNSAGVENQNVCVGEEINTITFNITGLTSGSVVVDNLPPGVGYIFNPGATGEGVLTISGTPTAIQTNDSPFYQIRTTGACDDTPLQGSLQVNPLPSLTLTSPVATLNQETCSNSDIIPITFNVENATGASIVWTSENAPAGITAQLAGGVFTISGTPVSVADTDVKYDFSIQLTGGSCDSELIEGGSIAIIPPIEIDEAIVLQEENSLLEACEASDRFIDITEAIIKDDNILDGNLIIEWTGPNGYTNNTKIIRNLAPGTYILNVYDNTKGCSTGPVEFIVKGVNPFTVTAEETPVGCNGQDGSIELTIDGDIKGNLQINWTRDGNSVGTGYTVTGEAGIYTASIKDEGEGACETPVIRVFEITQGSIDLRVTEQSNVQCFNAEDGSFTFTVNSEAPIASYSLFNAATQQQLQGATITPNANGVSVTDLAPGSYYIGATDANGCFYTFKEQDQIVEIKNSATSLLEITDATITDSSCGSANNGTISLVISGGVPFGAGNVVNYNIQWRGISATNSAFRQNIANIEDLAPGEYEVTISDAVGCEITEIYTVEESSSIVVIPTITDIDCNNPDGGQVNFEISGGLPPYNFKLFLIDPDTETQIDYGAREDITNFFNLRGLEAGNYILEVRDQGADCVKQKEFEIKNLTDLEVTAINLAPELCSLTAGDLYVDIETSIAASDVRFYYNDEVINTDNVTQLESRRFKLYISDPTEIFTVKVANLSGCFSPEFFVNSSLTLPNISYTSDTYEQFGEYRINDPIVFTTDHDLLTIPKTYSYVSWEFGDNSYKEFSFADNATPDENNEFINQVFHTYTVNGIYQVTYRIYNEFGCIKEEIIDLKIGEGYEIIVPSAFTPNNDNINDYFRPVFSGFVDIYMAVYDQQGNMIYTMQDEVSNLEDNWGWNGLINNTGTPLSGPYRYIINATSIDGEIVNRIGEVFLIN